MSYIKGPTNGWTSKQQTESVDKGSLALISGEIFQANSSDRELKVILLKPLFYLEMN